jgi:putative inorganic carbon (hco3(-)) transporter
LALGLSISVILSSLNAETILFALVAAASAGSLVSIALSQILLGVALAWLLIKIRPLHAPRACWLLAFFFAWTLLSTALSPTPTAALPQIKKFYVWLIFPLAYMAVRTVARAQLLFRIITAAGLASALWSLVQFARKYSEARALGQPFSQYYDAARITGFMSHWMTFGGGMLLVFSILGAVALFGTNKTDRRPAAVFAVVVALAIALGFTRSIWLATAIAAGVLILQWRPLLLAAMPIALVAGALFAPEPLHTRIVSIWQPKAGDSNLHREALRATGLNMVAAHPVFGFGPEQVGRNVPAYMPQRYQPIPANWWVGHLHNQFLHYAAERGLPAAIALLGFFLWLARDQIRWRNGTFLRAASLASIAGILAGGLFEVNLGDSEVLALFLAIVGTAEGVRSAQQLHRAPSRNGGEGEIRTHG